MIKLSKISRMAPSPIRKMFDLARGMENIVSFGLGEPDFTTPVNIIEAAKKQLDEGNTHYTPNAGILPLREAVANKLKEYDRVEYDPNTEIMITSGGMEGLYLTMLAALNPGDEVILTDPSYVNYHDQVSMCNGVPKYVPVYEEDGFNYNPENLEKAITSKTKAILINSPANPTGAVASRELLEKIADIAIKNDLLVIFDEVYKYLLYDNLKFCNIASIPGMKERTVVIDSCSKTYAMTGWRVGFVAGPKELVSNLPKIQENVCSCVPAFSQYAAIEGLKNSQASVDYMNKKYLERRNVICDGINSIEHLSCKVPKGAFYIFVNIKKTGLTSEEFAVRLLKEEAVIVSPGSGFGKSGEGFVRMSYATSIENINEGLKRIKHFVQKVCSEK